MSQVPRGGGKFIKAKELKTGDKCIVKTEANWEESDFQGQKANQYVCDVEFKGEIRRLKLTVASCNEIAPVYGNDSLEWIGRELKLESVKVIVGGEVKYSILASPIGVVTEEKTAWDEEDEIS